MEKFAERYTEQNKDVFPSADVAFILAFSIIMLNTDLHNPAIKEDRRMTRDGFIRNNRGICDGQNLPDELLYAIFDRIQANPISLKEDDEARERAGDAKSSGIVSSLGPTSFFASHYEEMDRARESNFQKERDHIVRTTEALLKRRRHGHEHSSKMPPSKARAEKHARPMSQFVRTEDSGLRDEYVSPMFDVAWGPALAAFSTAMESANGTVGALIAIASDDELEFAAENAAETIEVCLTGFRFAVCTAGLCGNHVARDAFVLALTRFSQLGTGTLLEPRHVRCIQTLMSLARDDGELLGATWEHIFRSLSEINRYHQLFHIMARNDRVVAAAAARRQRKVEERERRRRDRDARLAAEEDAESLTDTAAERLPQQDSDTDDSLAGSDLFDEDDDFLLEEDMDARAIDEANARVVYDAVSETVIETIYERSATLSAQSVKDFVKQLCFVSRSEISVGGASLLYNNKGGEQFHHNQVNIYCLQKLVEVSHYNMESRPRLIFSDLWSIVADHLTFAALHFNPAIAMYAVDSFRQLSIHYLKRDELEVFEFQKRFLKPLDIVMAQSEQSSTKELLLNCVDRIILVFKPKDSTTSSGVVASSKGGLRSGWIPILSILGIAGVDPDRDIAKQSFKILMSEILLCLKDKPHSCVLLSEHFVEAVSALFMFISGPHDDISRKAMETLLKLTEYLVKDGGTMPQVRRKATTIPSSAVQTLSNDSNEDLELWWPILLGLSRAVGDSRPQLRLAALETLMKVITGYFFPSDPDIHTKRKAAHDDIQTLQIVFRGVLFPILEYAELDSEKAALPSLPANFERFLTVPLDPALLVGEVDAGSTSWLETMFDPFLDACISLCLRSILVFKQSPLIDEVLALLTNCLMSDSGLLAVRGLHRLEQFLTSDLSANVLNDEIWAAVSHMLRKCLLIRDLPALPEPPKAPESQADVDSDGHDLQQARKEDYLQSVKEFVDEDAFFRDRRYIPSNATMVIGMFLSSDHFTIGLRWRLFLIAGLGRGIVEWERAAILLEGAPSSDPGASSAPSYNETAMYGRMWMNRFILQLASVKEIAQAPADADVKSNRFAAGRKLVAEETQRLLSYFLKSEHAAAQYSHYAKDEALHTRYTSLVMELLSGFGKMDGEHLKDLAWINPVLLGTCIQSKNENIRLAVQKLVQRMAPTPSPYPAPTSTSPAKEAAPLTPTATDQSEEATEQPVDLDPVQADDTIVISDPEVDKSTPALVEEVVEASSITIPESPDEVLTESDRLAEGVLGEEEAATPPAGEASSFEPAVTLPEDYVERAEQLGLSPLHVVQAAFQKADTYVLDIRTDEEIALGFIAHPNWKQCDGSRTENAILSSAPETIVPDKNATIILYCQSGRRANKAKEILLEQGYTGAILNAGGYEDMKAIL
jgi:rhodanese-related sulfurtransferase